MGEETKVLDVQAENNGTLIQIDVENSRGKDRIFIDTFKILKAINNYLYILEEQEIIKSGAEKLDPNSPVYGLLN